MKVYKNMTKNSMQMQSTRSGYLESGIRTLKNKETEHVTEIIKNNYKEEFVGDAQIKLNINYYECDMTFLGSVTCNTT